jgi:hypothetical protein
MCTEKMKIFTKEISKDGIDATKVFKYLWNMQSV